MGYIGHRLPWSALVLAVSLVSGVAAQGKVATDSTEVAAEVRAFLRDRADGNVAALVDHIWPAKIKPNSHEERGPTLIALARIVSERTARRAAPAKCPGDEVDVVFGDEWAVAGIITWRAAYTATSETCASSLALIPLQRVAGRWKVSGAMP